MIKVALAWGITWRMLVWGVLSGTGLGFLYGTLVRPIGGGLIGFIIGGFLGLGLGLLDGLVLAAITHFTLHRLENPSRYRAISIGVTTTLTGLGALLGLAGFTESLGATSPGGWIFYTLIPTMIAIVMTLIASIKVTTWAERISRSPEGPVTDAGGIDNR